MKNIYIFTLCILFWCIFTSKIVAEDLKNSQVNAISAILIDKESGRVLWEKNAREKRSMASTTKIMTAIVALEHMEKEQICTVSSNAAQAPPTKLKIRKGEKYYLEDMLKALMMVSANDVAVCIAENIGGSVQDFAKLMNNKAKELGAYDTTFVTPNGLDDTEYLHSSTAYDMAIITRYALNNEKFKEIISTKVHSFTTVDSKRSLRIQNTNRLLSEMSGAYGVKTGYTNKAGHCFIGAVKRENLDIISVVLGSGWGSFGKEAKWKDTKKILQYGIDNYHMEIVAPKNKIVGNVYRPDKLKKNCWIKVKEEEKMLLKNGNNCKEIITINMVKDGNGTVDNYLPLTGNLQINGKFIKSIDLVTNGNNDIPNTGYYANEMVKNTRRLFGYKW